MTDVPRNTSIDFLADNHIHTSFCNHASGSMADYVARAVAIGMRRIVFLEHMEEGIRSARQLWLSDGDFAEYFRQGHRLQEEYRGQIEIGLGVECGFNPRYADRLMHRLSAYQWDQIGISCHFIEVAHDEDHLNLFSRRREQIERVAKYPLEELFSRYLGLLTEAIQVLPGTMLCHLDGALRYVAGLQLHDDHYRQIEKLLDGVAQKGMALEYNTSGIAIRGEIFPAEPIRRLAAARNIPVVLSSDAHNPDDVGRGFQSLVNCL